MAENKDYSLNDPSTLFKHRYGKQSDATFNASNPVLSRIKKNELFTGDSYIINNPMSFSGGVGNASLPKSNTGKYENATIYSKQSYAMITVSREALKAASNDEGAFVRMTKEPTKKGLESFMRNYSRQLFGDGSGILGRGIGAGPAVVTGTGSAASPFVVQLDVTQFHDAKFEERDYVQVVTGLGVIPDNTGGVAEVDLLEIVQVNPTTKTVYLSGVSAKLSALVAAVLPLDSTSGLCMQGSYLADFTGLRAISNKTVLFDAGTDGTLYGVAIQRRWKMYVVDAAAAALTKVMLNDMMLTIDRRSGKTPNLIVCGYTQFAKLLNLSEDQKRYNLMPRDSKFAKEQFAFEAIEYMSTSGPVPVVVDRMSEDGEIWFLNDDFIEGYFRPGMAQWADEDGAIFSRIPGKDSYEARYCLYGEIFITPPFHGHLKHLAL
jgi:hypothetical protein